MFRADITKGDEPPPQPSVSIAAAAAVHDLVQGAARESVFTFVMRVSLVSDCGSRTSRDAGAS